MDRGDLLRLSKDELIELVMRLQRPDKTNSYHWVFHCKDAVVHQPDHLRAARVVEAMMDGHAPDVWISDRYSAQQKHGGGLAFHDGEPSFASSSPKNATPNSATLRQQARTRRGMR